MGKAIKNKIYTWITANGSAIHGSMLHIPPTNKLFLAAKREGGGGGYKEHEFIYDYLFQTSELKWVELIISVKTF